MTTPATTLGSRDVQPLALGAHPFGWTSDEATSHAVLDTFPDGGGSVIDTADSDDSDDSDDDEVARLTAASDRVGH